MKRALHLACMLMLAVSAYALDLTGKWKGTLADPAVDVLFDMKADGNMLTGSMPDDQGKMHPFTKGKIDGDKISFVVESEWQGNPITLVMNGTIDGETIKLTMATEDGGWSSETVLKKQ